MRSKISRFILLSMISISTRTARSIVMNSSTCGRIYLDDDSLPLLVISKCNHYTRVESNRIGRRFVQISALQIKKPLLDNRY